MGSRAAPRPALWAAVAETGLQGALSQAAQFLWGAEVKDALEWCSRFCQGGSARGL